MKSKLFFYNCILLLGIFFFFSTNVYAATANIVVYGDFLSPNWKNWSWGSSVTLSNMITFKTTKAWGALYLHNDTSQILTNYSNIIFSAKASVSGQKYKIGLNDGNNNNMGYVPLENYGGTLDTNWKTYQIPLSKLNPNNWSVKGITVQDALGKAQDSIYIDNIVFAPSTSIAPVPIPNPTPTPNGNTNAYTTSGGKIYQNGSVVKIQGVNWFGFEGGSHVVHGLWSRGYKEMMTQMKTLGFNAIRLPYCPATIDGVAPSSIDYTKNADLMGLNSLQVLDKVVTEANNQKIYVLLDNHNPDCTAISDLWYGLNYDENHWITDLTNIAARYKNLSYFLGLDLKNEPKGIATWGTGNKATDWNLASERAGKAVLAVNQNILILVEGIQSSTTCSGNTGHFWGGNLEPANCTPIDTASIPANKLIYSPHVYGPDVANQAYFNDFTFPKNMPAIWDRHFGYLADKGTTVVPTEWGGKYGNGGLTKDVTWQDALVSYFKNKKICSTFYWDWNPNSGDTGGILQDDWKTPWKNKVDMLNAFYAGCN